MRPTLAAGAAAVAVFLASTTVNAGVDHASHMQHSTFSAGEPGDAKKPARVVQVTMTEADGKMLFTPSSIEVAKDEQVRFVLRNGGELDHEFVLGTTAENLKHADSMKMNAEMKHDDPNAMALGPENTGELLWKFSKTGEFEYACLIPGHREAGMIGTITVN